MSSCRGLYAAGISAVHKLRRFNATAAFVYTCFASGFKATMSQLGRRGDPFPLDPPAKSLKDEVDEASMSSTLLTPLNQLQGLAHTLFLSLSPPQTKPPLPPPL